MIFKLSLYSILALSLFACASKQTHRPYWAFKQEWIRSAEMKENLQGRVVHRFTPISYNGLIIVGHALDGVTAFNEKSARVAWRFPMKDGVEPGATLYQNTLFFGASDGQFYALNAGTGQVLWTYPLRAEGLGRPTVQGDTVYILGGNSVLHALEVATGKMKWVYTRRDSATLSIRGASRPLIRGENLYISFADGVLVNLNKNSGSVIWESTLNKQRRFRDIDSAPITDGNKIFLSGYDDAFYAVDRATGKLIWRVDDGGYDEALLENGTIFYSTTNGKVLALKAETGKVLWSFQGKGFMTGPQSVSEKILVVGEWGDRLIALDKKTGDFITSFEPGRGVTSVPMIRENKIYFMSHEGNLFCLTMQPRRMKQVGVLQ